MSNLYHNLSEPFPQEMERTVTKSGTNLTYIPVSEIINRLNKIIGVEKWSFQIIQCGRDTVDTDFVTAHVRITALMENPTDNQVMTVIRDGIGGQKIKRNKQGAIMDLGDEFKGAISDALKKAAQTLGVGLYLARTDDAIEIEQAIEVSASQPVVQPEPVSGKYVQVKELFDALSDDKKRGVKEFWADYSGGTSKPLSKMNDEELEIILSEIVRLNFDGAMVVESPSKKKAPAMPERKDLD
jgi:hypothetical protein